MPDHIRSFVLIISAGCLLACSHAGNDKNAPAETDFNAKTLIKSDIDTVLDIHIRQARSYLRELMIKLYRRNPRELKKTRLGINENLQRMFHGTGSLKFHELGKKRQGDAIHLAFDENYQGDRVFAFMAGLTSIVMASYNYQQEFFMLDHADPQKLYNSARNIEIAVWKLEHDRDSHGELFIYSNSLPDEVSNLSYERLFGKLIATQDTIAQIIADRSNRTIKKVIQQMATAVFLPI